MADKIEALVLSNEDGEQFVLPIEYIGLSKVNPKSKVAIEEALKGQETIELGAGLSFQGILTKTEDEGWPGYVAGRNIWPHYVDTDD